MFIQIKNDLKNLRLRDVLHQFNLLSYPHFQKLRKRN